MKPLELYYPAKPFRVTQAFGIYNPAYLKFGFDAHNGIDFAVDYDKNVLAMCDGQVYETGYNDGAGNYVKYKTLNKVKINEGEYYVAFMYMHAEKILINKGDTVSTGTPLIIAGNTGFSTGPHTHISCFTVDENNKRLQVGSKSSDYCLDFSKYFNGFYADHAKFLESLRHLPLIKQLFQLMKRIL